MIWLAAALAAGLVAAYMARPRFRKREVSSAQFFKKLPPPRLARARLSLAPPKLTRSFFLQLLVFLCVFAALILTTRTFWLGENQELRLWVVVDTSSSMNAGDGTVTRMDLVKQEIRTLRDHIQKEGQGWSAAFKLSSFHMERRDLLTTNQIGSIAEAVVNLEATSLGTDHRLALNLEDPEFKPTHILVITDAPPPDGLSKQAIPTWWRQVGNPLPNMGFANIQARRDLLTGTVRQVVVEVSTHGPIPPQARIKIMGPQDALVLNEALSNAVEQSFLFSAPESGQYRLSLSPSDGYTPDNEAVIQITAGQTPEVDWRLPERTLFNALGWSPCRDNCDLLVTSRLEDAAGEVPALVVSSGTDILGPVEVQYFLESSPLLTDLNLDAVETAVSRASPPPPAPWAPVLTFTNGTVWAAQRWEPPGALVHGPLEGTDVSGRLGSTVFFNALRHLLKAREPQPLYTLTSPLEPQAEGVRLALHPGEGETWREPSSTGRISDLRPVSNLRAQQLLWPWLLLVALIFLALERILNVYGGNRWR